MEQRPRRFLITRPLPSDLEWIVTRDPAGCYRTNLFRLIDIEHDRREPCCWSDGTEFQHIYIPEVKRIQNREVQTDFIMSTRCSESWKLYEQFCQVSKAVAQAGTDPRRDHAYTEALSALRRHLATCPECLAGLDRLAAQSTEHPPHEPET